MPASDRAFYEILYRSLLAIAHAIKRYKLAAAEDCTATPERGRIEQNGTTVRKGAAE